MVFLPQINRERVGSFRLESEGGYRDVALLGDCDSAARKICELCGWINDLDKIIGGRRTQKNTPKCH